MITTTPLISVIMPSYCQGQYIKEAIESVLTQTYSNLELIIVDNFSNDDTTAVISSFSDERIRFFQLNNEGIIAKSRNFGVSNARGEIIAFLDTDDVWSNDKLAIQLPLLNKPGIGAVVSGFVPIGETQYAYNYLKKSEDNEYQEFTLDDMSQKNSVMTSSLIMRKESFLQLNGFDESQVFAYIEDWELWLRLAHDVGNILCFLGKPLLYYRVIKKKNRDKRKICLNMLKIAEKLRKIHYLTDKQCQSMCDNHYVSIAIAHLEVGDRDAIRYFFRALLRTPALTEKSKAIAGIFLSVLPKKMSLFLFDRLYYLRSRLIY